MKLLAIFLVLWGHSIQHLRSTSPYDDPVFRFIYSFHMPLFMALSGFFAEKMTKKSLKEVVTSRFRQLILPLVTADIIILAISAFHPDEQFLNWFWFLKSAFVCAIVYYLISRTKKMFWPLLIIVLCLSQLVSQFKFCNMFPSFVAGAMIGRYFPLFSKYSNHIFWYAAIIFLGLLSGWNSSFFNIEWGELKNNLPLQDFAVKFIITRLYIVAIGLSGATMLIALFEYLSHKMPATPLGEKMRKAGQMTLGIYIFQTFVLELLISRYVKLDMINVWVYDLIVAPLIAIAVMAICLAIVKLMQANRYTSFLFLGEKLKR